jgi:hypothetical protein
VILASQLFSTGVMAQDTGTPVVPVYEEPAPLDAEEQIDPTPTLLPPDPEPTATALPPTPTPEPEPAPVPALGFQLNQSPECALAADQPAELASGGTIDYACTSQIELSGEQIATAGIAIAWTIGAIATPGWQIALLPPSRAPDEPAIWTDLRDGAVEFTFEQFDPAGSSAEAGAIQTVVAIDYRLRIHRPACLAGAPVIELDQSVAVASPFAIAVDRSTAIPEPLHLAPATAAIPTPSVAFDGGLNFGTITATAAGLIQTRLDGTIGITISGLDTACGAWVVQLSATPIVDDAGAIREGFSLLFGECDLADGCIALTLTAGPNQPATHTTTLVITLQTPLYAALGALGTTLNVAVIAAD